MTLEHLELPLHNLFVDRFTPPQAYSVPSSLQPATLTPRKLQVLRVHNALNTLYDKYDFNKSFCEKIPGFPPLNEYSEVPMKRALSRLAASWRVGNGVFTISSLKKATGDLFENTMAVAKNLDDDQWFFGTIFTVYKDTWTMVPSIDRTATPAQAAALSRIDLPEYQLPDPQDVDESYRKALREHGRHLLDFQEWVEKNSRYFPDHLQDDPDYKFESRPQQSRAARQQDSTNTRNPRNRDVTYTIDSEDSYDSDDDFTRSATQGDTKKRRTAGKTHPPAKRHRPSENNGAQTSAMTSGASSTSSRHRHTGNRSPYFEPRAHPREAAPLDDNVDEYHEPRSQHGALPTRFSPHPIPHAHPQPLPNLPWDGAARLQSQSRLPTHNGTLGDLHARSPTAHDHDHFPEPHGLRYAGAPKAPHAAARSGPVYDAAPIPGQPNVHAQHLPQNQTFTQNRQPAQAQQALQVQAEVDVQVHRPAVNVATSVEAATNVSIMHYTTLQETVKAYPEGVNMEYTQLKGFKCRIIIEKES